MWQSVDTYCRKLDTSNKSSYQHDKTVSELRNQDMKTYGVEAVLKAVLISTLQMNMYDQLDA
jgi:hypothetical protein